MSIIAVAAVLGAFGLAGCNAAVDQRTLEADFSGGTTQAQLLAAMKACTGVAPNTSPIPLTKQQDDEPGLAGNSDVIRFSIEKASDKEIAELTSCLNKQPGVYGVVFNSAEDD